MSVTFDGKRMSETLKVILMAVCLATGFVGSLPSAVADDSDSLVRPAVWTRIAEPAVAAATAVPANDATPAESRRVTQYWGLEPAVEEPTPLLLIRMTGLVENRELAVDDGWLDAARQVAASSDDLSVVALGDVVDESGALADATPDAADDSPFKLAHWRSRGVFRGPGYSFRYNYRGWGPYSRGFWGGYHRPYVSYNWYRPYAYYGYSSFRYTRPAYSWPTGFYRYGFYSSPSIYNHVFPSYGHGGWATPGFTAFPVAPSIINYPLVNSPAVSIWTGSPSWVGSPYVVGLNYGYGHFGYGGFGGWGCW